MPEFWESIHRRFEKPKNFKFIEYSKSIPVSREILESDVIDFFGFRERKEFRDLLESI